MSEIWRLPCGRLIAAVAGIATLWVVVAIVGAATQPEPISSSDLIINGAATAADAHLFTLLQPQQPEA